MHRRILIETHAKPRFGASQGGVNGCAQLTSNRPWTVWPVQHAKARFSELLDACQREGPQVVTRRGTETAVLVPIEQWRRLQAAARPSLKELLLSPEARTDTLVPPRGAARRRPVAQL